MEAFNIAVSSTSDHSLIDARGLNAREKIGARCMPLGDTDLNILLTKALVIFKPVILSRNLPDTVIYGLQRLGIQLQPPVQRRIPRPMEANEGFTQDEHRTCSAYPFFADHDTRIIERDLDSQPFKQLFADEYYPRVMEHVDAIVESDY